MMKMKKIFYTVAVVSSFVCSAVYAQQAVLSCAIQAASGEAMTRPVDNVKVGTTLDIPLGMLAANGTKYEGTDLFNTERTGERTSIAIDRENGAFEFHASSGGILTDDIAEKKATGVCKLKKLAL